MRWACVVAALGAAAYLVLEPSSADLAAQQYRAGLVREAGFELWDNGWFAGHHTPGYSLLFPPLGALSGCALRAPGRVRRGGAVRAGRAGTLGRARRQRAAAWFAAARSGRCSAAA